MQTRQISNFVINKLTKAQYDATTKNADEVYITTDDVGLTSSDITTALGYVPYNSTNPNGYITSSALNGYATQTWVGQQGYLTGITSAQVTTALGYTPYNATNPNGYTSNVGTVTSVNNELPDANGNVTVQSGSSRNIGEIVASTIPLTDAGLHLLDGSLLPYGIYQAFIDYIGEIYDSGDYPSMFATEADWQSSVSQYGVCGKFVYNSVNNTVRLPKITGFVEGASSVSNLGDLVEAGLPNITGNVYQQGNGTSGMYGSVVSGSALYSTGTSTNAIQPAGSATGVYSNISFNASRSNPIYGNSSTVQPQTIKVLYYIVVATLTKTDIEVDIDEIATDLNGKVDKLGDTMTGNLKISKETSSASLTLQRNDCAIGDVATGNQINVGSLSCYDRNNDNMSIIQTRIGTDGSTGIQLALRRHNLSSYNSVIFSTLPDGSATFDFPKCTTKPTTTSTASSIKVSAVVKNYLNGTSGYVKYSDGLIIQWGQNSTASEDAQISLLTSFTTTTYFVTLQLVNKRNGSQQNITPYNKSTSSFYRSCNGGSEYNNPIAWMAIGY